MIHPWSCWGCFLAQALAVQDSPRELAWRVGDPAAKFGDLYCTQKLCFALRAFALSEPDTEGRGRPD